MVIVVFTRSGYDEMQQLIASRRWPVWVNANVLSGQEIATLREGGIDLTAFTSPTDPEDQERIGEAIAIIGEHHPGERLWVEFQSADADRRWGSATQL